VLGLGAWLVIQQQASGGVMIASSIMTSKALGPVELAIANWRSFIAARQGWSRLTELLKRLPDTEETMDLPAPRQSLAVENLTLGAPGSPRPILKDVSFRLDAGSAVGIIGPSASGKSSLARALVGIWQPARGAVRLDGASLNQWTSAALGPHIGYLPQDVELIEGTLAENIARFTPDASSDAIIAAAEAAGVHQMIVALPDGYETRIGEGGVMLSAGQCQRVALARALYGNPFLIVLDEPNSNLDTEGEQALITAIQSARLRGSVVAIVAHRPSALAGVDKILVLREGTVQAFGPREEILAQVLRRNTVQGDPVTPLNPQRATPTLQPRTQSN
jgi:ATP-binding cassette subfamily C protein